MKRVRKGNPGYVAYEKKKRALIMLLMFAIPIGLYAIAYHINGSNRSIFSIVAVLGLIPAARYAVNFIMIMLQPASDPEAYQLTEQYAGNLVRGYEIMVTAYEGRMPLDAIIVCGSEVAALSLKGKKDQFAVMEKNVTRILNSNGYFGENVKIFDNTKHYTDRIRQIAKNPDQYREGISFKPDEKYPELTRDELIFHTILAISV